MKMKSDAHGVDIPTGNACMTPPSPLPWKLDKNGYIEDIRGAQFGSLAIRCASSMSQEATANAAFVVTAVNAYPLVGELVAIAEDAFHVAQVALKQGHPVEKEVAYLESVVTRAQETLKGEAK